MPIPSLFSVIKCIFQQCCSKAKDLKVEAKAKDTQAEAKDMQVEAKAKDMDQGQLAFFRFQYEISKCGSFGHEIMVRKQCMA